MKIREKQAVTAENKICCPLFPWVSLDSGNHDFGSMIRSDKEAREERLMQAQSTKQEALNAIEQMPDNVGMEEIMYRLYVIENIRHGQRDAAEGKTQVAEEVLKDIQEW